MAKAIYACLCDPETGVIEDMRFADELAELEAAELESSRDG